MSEHPYRVPGHVDAERPALPRGVKHFRATSMRPGRVIIDVCFEGRRTWRTLWLWRGPDRAYCYAGDGASWFTATRCAEGVQVWVDEPASPARCALLFELVERADE